MKNEILFFLLLSGISALAADSLNCSMIDWLDAPTGHNFNHYGTSTYYEYSGTEFWDLAMGDSFLVWLPGTNLIITVDAFEDASIDTVVIRSFGSADRSAIAINDTVYYQVGSGFIYSYINDTDSLRLLDYIHTTLADYHYAALEDSFLYTVTPGALTCINVADPESIFIYRTCAPAGCNCGLEVVDGYAYTLTAGSHGDEYGNYWPVIIKEKYDMINSEVADRTESIWEAYISLGDMAADDDFVYYVSSEMEGPPDWTIGENYLFIYGSDTTYNFDSRWDGQGVFGVDVISENLLAVGFEYGLSILNISNLDSIYEAAYYIDTLGNIDFTHFALKEDRLYAMGHPRDSYATLYMFELAECVISGIEENLPSAKPDAFAISAYPNPFNSAVSITVGEGLVDRREIPRMPSRVEVFDINGRMVENMTVGEGLCALPREYTQVLPYEFVWQPDESLGSGVYLVRARFGEETSRRIVYLK